MIENVLQKQAYDEVAAALVLRNCRSRRWSRRIQPGFKGAAGIHRGSSSLS